MANIEGSFKSILQPTDDSTAGTIGVVPPRFESSSLPNISVNLVLTTPTDAGRQCSLKRHTVGDQYFL